MRAKAYPKLAATRQVSLAQIATALGWKLSVTRRRIRHSSDFLSRYETVRIGQPPSYDAQAIDVLRGLYGQPRDALGSERDWLDDYLQGGI